MDMHTVTMLDCKVVLGGVESSPSPLLYCVLCQFVQVHDGEEYNTVAAGEDISVEVTFTNPLSIKLSLSRVRLLVQFTPAGEAGAATPGSPVAAADGDAAAAPSPEQASVVECQLSLHPGKA